MTTDHSRCLQAAALYGPRAACGPECLVVERYAWAMGARGEALPEDVPPLAREAWEHGRKSVRRPLDRKRIYCID